MSRRPDYVVFFAALLLLTSLLEAELPRGMVTLGWGVEAVLVFVFALWMRERAARLRALALLLLALGKIILHDVWGVSPRDRYLTFIALGMASLAVSWLYTRYREIVRAYPLARLPARRLASHSGSRPWKHSTRSSPAAGPGRNTRQSPRPWLSAVGGWLLHPEL
jgi:hypothetical protein